MPTLSEAFAIAAAHHQAGRLGVAEEICRRILGSEPNHADAHNLLGVIALQTGQHRVAVDRIRRALALQPLVAAYYNNLGNALQAQGELDAAIAAYQRGLELQADMAELHNSLGNALVAQGKADEAVLCFQRALDVKPHYAKAWHNLAGEFKRQGRLVDAMGCYQQAVRLSPERPEIGSSLLYALHFCPEQTAESIRKEHHRWSLQHAEPLAERTASHANDRSPERRLRVGYVSPDFRRHVVGFNLRPLFRHHDHRQWEVYCYADVAQPDFVTEDLRSCADVWRSTLGMADESLVEQIRSDRIDVLVDLSLHMKGNRLLVFARKPAPVQVTFVGYPGTTGLTTIDYRITDPYLDPPGFNDAHYSEQAIRLADSFWCYEPLETDPDVSALPALSEGVVTFGFLGSFGKVNEQVLHLWAQLLRQVGRSRLVLLASEGSHRKRTRELLAGLGVSPDRVVFVAHQPRDEYLSTYHRLDVGLDAFPYNGHTTCLDAFWMGVPVVSLVGRTAVGRAGLSQLTNLGLPELAARDADGYVRIAAQLAGDLPRLAELRATLRERMQRSPLMDAPRFARNVEAAYREMWRRWCGGAGE